MHQRLQKQYLAPLASAGGFTLWHYRCLQPYSVITNARFLEPVLALLNEGDLFVITFQGKDRGKSGLYCVQKGANEKEFLLHKKL